MPDKYDISIHHNPMHLSYLAGIFDGEGWVSISKHQYPRYTMYIGVANTFLPVLELFRLAFEGALRPQGKRKSGYKQCYTWQASQWKAYSALKILHPYLYIKRMQAEIGIEFMENIKTDKGRVYQEEADLRESFRLKLAASK